MPPDADAPGLGAPLGPPSAPATVDAAVGRLLEAIDVVVPLLAPLVIAEEELPEAEPVADAVGAGVMVNTVICVTVLVWRFEPRKTKSNYEPGQVQAEVKPEEKKYRPGGLAESLLQRHHFLQISPDDPVEYLCWPATQSARVVELLNIFSSPGDQPGQYYVRYTSDPEHTYAHVQVVTHEQGVRLLFEWDDEDGWKYHDSQLMPFPSTSRSALHPPKTPAEQARERYPSVARGFLDDEDRYWNAYNAPLYESISAFSALAPRNTLREGSADSTVPSPLPNHRKLETAFPAYYTQQEEAIPIPADTIHSLPPPDNIHTPTSNEPSSTFARDTPSPLSTLDNSDLETPASGNPGQYAHLAQPVKVTLNDMSYSNGRHAGNGHANEEDDEFAVEEDKAVTESIKGIYYLWKARKSNQPDEESSDVFLRIVREAVTQS
ncbi:uncharacterized protein BJ212DRAFT_1510633 [Suillus subaureus]|uniref:Uncharacterized protein n=1 Tax=Suillus subaureus TaxID=48587 RepID=A0A9P7EM76_9AGAM|nr:uncharacterized protein BJ212DRAFT_1510633 [Suillus subaureus]KAG1825966.1 hypothetical protein BJ212DRAFT_1510633 [Suillus subaureus]